VSERPETDGYERKLADLRARLAALESLAVAFSGGVDSAVLLHAAREALGERALGVIADSPSLPRRELEGARALALEIGAELVVLPTGELEDPSYRRNAGDRCYFCKSALFRAMEAFALERGVRALAFGEIADDLIEDRPGARAARELAVHAPLSAAGFTKEDVRRYAREHGLAVADKPSSACLSSRIPHGSEVTRERLARVERAEERLKDLGLRQLRVRDHGARARVEVGEAELDRARTLAPEIEAALGVEGWVSHELAVYRSAGARARP